MEVNPRLAFAPIAQEPKQLLKAIKGYEKEPLLSLEKACEPLLKILDELHENIIIAKKNSRKPADGLTQDESASIHLYTMEWEESDNSLYAVLNRALRTPERQILKPWFKYLKLFLTALFKLPSTGGQLWRGVKEDLTEIYPKGEVQIWWSFSSCTSSLEVLQQPQFIGKSGNRTLFCIEGELSGKNISRHSYFKNEDEILLLPGTSLQVRSSIHRADGFHLIHLRQVNPSDELLVSPFTDTSSQVNSSLPLRSSKLTQTLISKQYDSDDDSSADESYSSSHQNSKFARDMDKYNGIDAKSTGGSGKMTTYFQSSTNGKSEKIPIPKSQTQKNAKGHIEIYYVDRMGNYIVVQNISPSNKDDRNLTGWSIKKTIEIDNHNKKVLVYEFPDYFILKNNVPVRILARNTSKKSLATMPRDGMISLVADNIVTWGTGTNMITQLFDDEGNEQAIYTQNFV